MKFNCVQHPPFVEDLLRGLESSSSQIGSDINQEKLQAISFWCYTFANLVCLCFFILFFLLMVRIVGIGYESGMGFLLL